VLPALNKRDGSVLKLAVTAVNQTSTLVKREDEVSLFNTQSGTRYLIKFSIGTPPQPVEVAIDTGSSDTWVNPTCSAADDATDAALCSTLPVFDPKSSSTLVDTGTTFDLDYGSGNAQGEFYKDSWVLGGATITGQQFGVATSSTELPNGLMGVGPGVELTGYPTIIDTLVTEGFTQSRAFSLDLRGVDTPTGSIIFGGVDTTKYTGALEKLPIIPKAQSPDDYDRYWIYLGGLGITNPGQSSQTLLTPASPGQAVFLDSGETLSRLPSSFVNTLLPSFPSAVLDPYGSGVYQVPCSVASQNGTVDFVFGSTTIHVPFHDFIWQAGANVCGLGVVVDNSTPLLGDAFLRAAYVVYDQDNQNLLLANAADCPSDNLVPISTGPNAVPSITGSCPTSSPTSSSSSSSTSTPALPTSSGIKYSNSSSTPTGPSSTLSTVYATTTYTISSCAPTITNCPYGQVTTDTVILYTTYCPVAGESPATGTPAATPATVTPVVATVAPVLVVPVLATSPYEVGTAYAYTSPTTSVQGKLVAGETGTGTTVAPYASSYAAGGVPTGTGTGAGSVYTPATTSASGTTSAKGQTYTGGAERVMGGVWMVGLAGLVGVALL
jgi:hypothetical protein